MQMRRSSFAQQSQSLRLPRPLFEKEAASFRGSQIARQLSLRLPAAQSVEAAESHLRGGVQLQSPLRLPYVAVGVLTTDRVLRQAAALEAARLAASSFLQASLLDKRLAAFREPSRLMMTVSSLRVTASRSPH